MTNLLRQITSAARTLREKRTILAAAGDANSEAARRIHRAQERIGRGKCACGGDDDEAARDYIERQRRGGAAE